MPLIQDPSALTAAVRALSHAERLALYGRVLAYEKARRRDDAGDLVARHSADPLGFITRVLGECVGESWATWRIVLKAAYGQQLDDEETARFREIAHRDPPRQRVKELWLIVGRRGGKDSVASMIATQAAVYANEGVALRPGERIVVPCFANSKDQAAIVFRYVRGYFEKVPALRRMIVGKLPDSPMSPISLSNDVDIRVLANNFRAPRGYAIGTTVFDEVGTWRSEDSATPDVETYTAVLPAMTPNAMVVGISSPYRQAGMLYEKWKRYHGDGGTDDILVIRAPTETFNPVYNRSAMERLLAEDPEKAAAEYFAEWRRDLADYVNRDVVESLVVRDRLFLERVGGTPYVAFCDPSGGSVDSMVTAVAHMDRKRNRAVLDCVYETRAPFNADSAVHDHVGVLRSYGLKTVEGDAYGSDFVRAAFRKEGIAYEHAEAHKSEIYLEALPLLNTGRVELLDSPRLINQICALERRTARGGRDSVDHPRDGHDDVANAALGALWKATRGGDAPVFSKEMVQRLQNQALGGFEGFA